MKKDLINILHSAGKLLLGYFQGPVDFEYKDSHSSIVTKADIEADLLIISMIRERYPDHRIISEEHGFIPNSSPYTWVIDPLDGTSNFASGIPWFGVMIAIFYNNNPVMAGIYLPVQDDLYFAEAGRGSFKNGEPISRLENIVLKDSMIAFGVDYSPDTEHFDRSISFYKALLENCRNIRSTNSLVDFLYVAEGKLGGVINTDTRIWDIAALGLIISETGGMIKSIDEGDIIYNLEEGIIDKVFPVMAGPASFIGSVEKILKGINL